MWYIYGHLHMRYEILLIGWFLHMYNLPTTPTTWSLYHGNTSQKQSCDHFLGRLTKCYKFTCLHKDIFTQTHSHWRVWKLYSYQDSQCHSNWKPFHSHTPIISGVTWPMLTNELCSIPRWKSVWNFTQHFPPLNLYHFSNTQDHQLPKVTYYDWFEPANQIAQN